MNPSEKSSCKLKSANRNTKTLTWKQVHRHSSPCVIMQMEGICCFLSTWSQMSLHRQAAPKNVLDPWVALCQNSNYYWCYTYDRKVLAGASFKHQSSLLFQPSAITKWPQKEGELQTHLGCCFHSLATLYPSLIRCTISLFNDASSHLYTDGNESLH
jgi:hypothetical protein